MLLFRPMLPSSLETVTPRRSWPAPPERAFLSGVGRLDEARSLLGAKTVLNSIPPFRRICRPGEFSQSSGARTMTKGDCCSIPCRFDFVLPEPPDLPLTPGTQILPYEAVREALLKIVVFDFQAMSVVRDLAGDRMVHILTQPPLKNLEATEKFPAWDYGDAAISPAHLRLKLYRIYASATRQWCAERGVPVIDPPFEGLTDDGFLRDEYLSNATHANVDYGIFWLRRMEQWL